MRKKIVAGNWKMNKSLSDGLLLVDAIVKELEKENSNNVLKIIAPPYTHIASVSEKIKHIPNLAVGAQNCSNFSSGAYTGETSVDMIASAGAKYVIIGHSERRQHFNETNELLAQKINMCLGNNLTPIFCLGESLEDRNANTHLEVVKQQLKESLYHLSATDFNKVIIAYEPVWAIGTGVTATSYQAQGMHNHIRSEINKKYGKTVSETISILYGGSCNAQNAKELFACIDVDGGLIGGASLKAADFIAIANSF
jgi:triosephosphate isomerase